jgi:hypothetical protein
MYYGTAGPAFVERLIQELPNLELCKRLDETFKDRTDKLSLSLSALQTRVMRSFAVIALAGELAILTLARGPRAP